MKNVVPQGQHARTVAAGFLAAVLLMIPLDSAGGATPAVRDLVEITDIDGLGVSPDGQYLAFRTVRADIARNSYDLEWHSVELQSGEVRAIGSGGDPVYVDPGLVEGEPPLWNPDGSSILFRAFVDGSIGVWQANADGRSVTPLIVRDEDVESLSLDPGGKVLIYKVGPSRENIRRAERDEYDSGILVDRSVDLAQNLYRGGSIDGRMASQRLVGYWFVRGGLLWRHPRQVRRFDISNRTDEPVGVPEPVPDFQPPSIAFEATARSPGGDSAEASWDGKTGWVEATLAGSPARLRCADPLCASKHVTALAWRPGAKELLITFTDRNRRQSLYLWDLAANRLRLLIESDGLLSGGRLSTDPCAVGPSAAYCVAASAASPPKLVAIDLDSGKAKVLFDPNSAWRSSYHPQVEQLSWKTKSGVSVAGTLLMPKEEPRRAAPLFINYYSCDGFLRGGEGDEWPIPALLASGFAVACVNAAPFTGSQDGVATYRTGLEAVSELITLLDQRGVIDRRKVAMGGFSFGSEVATWIATHSNLISALSIASAQSDPAGYWYNAIGGGDRPALMRKVWGLGPPEETPARWKLVSPALNAASIRAPILLQLPEQEARRIPEYYARLTEGATPAELYAYPDEDHLMVQPRHRLAAYERNLDWFRYWLQNVRDAEPAKASQYVHWDLLKSRWTRQAGAQRSMTGATARAQPSR